VCECVCVCVCVSTSEVGLHWHPLSVVCALTPASTTTVAITDFISVTGVCVCVCVCVCVIMRVSMYGLRRWVNSLYMYYHRLTNSTVVTREETKDIASTEIFRNKHGTLQTGEREGGWRWIKARSGGTNEEKSVN
jgi:hypothetical protein